MDRGSQLHQAYQQPPAQTSILWLDLSAFSRDDLTEGFGHKDSQKSYTLYTAALQHATLIMILPYL